MQRISKKLIETAMGNVGFSYGYEYSKRKTIIVNEGNWLRAINALITNNISFAVLRVAKSPCTGEISFKK